MPSVLTPRAPLSLAALALLAVVAAPQVATARPGTHPAAISTFDTRASSVVFAYRRGILDGGGFNHISYNANFTNTTGVLSAQFGLHYVNFKGAETEAAANGVAGGAIALFNIPVTRRLDNGLPIVGVAPYLGIVPTAIISGQQSFLSLPAVLGMAFPMSPGEAITLTPWFEMALSVDVDTVVRPITFTPDDVCAQFGFCYDPNTFDPNDPSTWPDTSQQTPTINFDANTVNEIVSQGVTVEVTASVPMRAGLDIALHLGDSMDFTAYGGVTTFGSAFSGTTVAIVGGSLVWRWDDIVPAVLPPERRLLRESCGDVEARFRTCPVSRTWLRPEQLQAERKEAEKARQEAEAAKQAPAPAPAAPAPAPVPAPAPAPAPAAPAPAPATPAPAPAAPAPAPAPAAPAPGTSAPLPPADFPR